MLNKMLIDSSHPEETRVVVVRGNRIEEFDFESQDKKQLKGNIYLARVTRVEPSLQAAFVEYGGNRHGFLAFSEIHPDYYQIPVADRQALLRAEAEDAAAEEDEEEERERGRGRRRRGGGRRQRGERAESASAEEIDTETAGEPVVHAAEPDASDEPGDDGSPDVMAHSTSGDVIAEDVSSKFGIEDVNGLDASEVESVGADDAIDEVRNRRRPMRRQYKIQEVIKRRQILLVQVVKEERGNKGAALTTYLSLAGRYSVLMPNTARGGGISRKITNAVDRKRLKDVVKDLDVPQGMGVILRTAGESRTKAEIKRDYEYLMRLWENVRTLTLESTAPALVYEEGSLIKRSVRDLYNKDIEDIQVAGEEGYREAKDFMRMLMPSHAKVVQPYRENVPLFVRYGVESQLDKMLQPQVTLKSGGYIIINQTEALVSIDVNSGRSTKEHSIEDTALQTNLEAAEEVARQLRLRDLAGLIVIDFIDMEENRNNRAVEKKMKDCLKNDRARIQVGRISHFGLLEMSRQRIRTSVLESTMQPCPHCGGTGHVRSESSVGLLVLRAIEEFLLKDSRYHITVHTPTATALYVLNHKRRNLADLEARFGLTITIAVDEAVASQHYAIFKAGIVERPLGAPAAPIIEPPALEMDDEPEDEADLEEATEPAEVSGGRSAPHDEQGDHTRKRRKRRRRRGGRDRDREFAPGEAAPSPTAQGEPVERATGDVAETADEIGSDDEQSATDSSGKKRRRGKRGGRRNRRPDETQGGSFAAEEGGAYREPDAGAENEPVEPEFFAQQMPRVAENTAVLGADESASGTEAAEVEESAPAKPARRSRKKAVVETAEEPVASQEAVVAEAPAKPARKSRKKAEPAAGDATKAAPEAAETAPEIAAAPPPVKKPAEPVITVVSGKPVPAEGGAGEGEGRKAGWWQRKGFF